MRHSHGKDNYGAAVGGLKDCRAVALRNVLSEEEGHTSVINGRTRQETRARGQPGSVFPRVLRNSQATACATGCRAER